MADTKPTADFSNHTKKKPTNAISKSVKNVNAFGPHLAVTIVQSGLKCWKGKPFGPKTAWLCSCLVIRAAQLSSYSTGRQPLRPTDPS